ncbi:MAG TPA: glutathione synthase [Myxococcaceae bacterium]|nr:glutathione synthase [Myxococcaceae bacterium]
MPTGRLRIGFWMDPLEGIVIHHDTTFALMLECQRRSHEILCFYQDGLYCLDGCARARMRSVSVRRERGRHFDVLSESDAAIGELDILFLRKDPPVDAAYWHATQLFELARGDRPFCINAPAGLRSANEKLFALKFADLVPRTLVSSDLKMLRSFVEEVGHAVLKPIDGFAGRGVLQVKPADANLNPILELMTARGTQAVIAQAYVPESRAGDKRIMLLNGEPLGAVLRVPEGGDPRGNMAAGAHPVKASLTARDREICQRLAPELAAHGLYLVGIDVLGDYLTEVNVTSPTGLVEIDSLDGSSLESRVIDFGEQHAAAARQQ